MFRHTKQTICLVIIKRWDDDEGSSIYFFSTKRFHLVDACNVTKLIYFQKLKCVFVVVENIDVIWEFGKSSSRKQNNATSGKLCCFIRIRTRFRFEFFFFHFKDDFHFLCIEVVFAYGFYWSMKIFEYLVYILQVTLNRA